MQKGIALAICMAIIMGTFTGCGKKDTLEMDAQQEAQKGRYVETEIALPEEWTDKTICQMFRQGEKLHFLVTS